MRFRAVFPTAAVLLFNVLAFALQSVQTSPPSASTTALSSDTLRLTFPGQHPQTLNLADFHVLPHKTVSFHNGHTNTDETYSGVLLSELLAMYGVPFGDKLHGKALSEFIVATGSDGYKAVLALAEVDPSFHSGDVLVADAMGGKPLDAKTGPFRLIVTEDKRAARSVHSLVSIEVKSAD